MGGRRAEGEGSGKREPGIGLLREIHSERLPEGDRVEVVPPETVHAKRLDDRRFASSWWSTDTSSFLKGPAPPRRVPAPRNKGANHSDRLGVHRERCALEARSRVRAMCATDGQNPHQEVEQAQYRLPHLRKLQGNARTLLQLQSQPHPDAALKHWANIRIARKTGAPGIAGNVKRPTLERTRMKRS